MVITEPLLGQICAILSATAFAFSNIYISRTKKSGGDKGVMFSVLVTLALSALLWLAFEGGVVAWPESQTDWRAIGAFALAGIFAMVFGRSLVFESIRRLGVTRSTAVKRLNPFFSALFAAVFLEEMISGTDLIGMGALALAFAILIYESFRRQKVNLSIPTPSAYLFGLFGAVAYASAYISRKSGLEIMQAPAFGTFLSATSGFIGFALLALVFPRYRGNFASMFRNLDRWVVIAAILISVGQILMFMALAYERVSTVVMIASLEIFIAIFLSVVLYRSERMPGPTVILSAVLAAAGVILVAGSD